MFPKAFFGFLIGGIYGEGADTNFKVDQKIALIELLNNRKRAALQTDVPRNILLTLVDI